MKAWDIVGYALDGACYHVDCMPESECTCSKDFNGQCEENCGGYGPNPIFASEEEWESMVCDNCLTYLDDDYSPPAEEEPEGWEAGEE